MLYDNLYLIHNEVMGEKKGPKERTEVVATFGERENTNYWITRIKKEWKLWFQTPEGGF